MTEPVFRTIYAQYRDPLFRFGYRLTGSADTAEDLVHDCFIGLFRDGFDEKRGSLRTYLYAAMRNLCRKHFRDSGHEDPSDSPPDSATPGGALNDLLSGEVAAAVRQAVAALPLLQREALVLFEYEGMALEEISKITEVDVGAVKSRLYRAREGLRKSLAPLREAAK
jgi:RNA polymerase sigma-70 factor (ECF subfamily)